MSTAVDDSVVLARGRRHLRPAHRRRVVAGPADRRHLGRRPRARPLGQPRRLADGRADLRGRPHAHRGDLAGRRTGAHDGSGRRLAARAGGGGPGDRGHPGPARDGPRAAHRPRRADRRPARPGGPGPPHRAVAAGADGGALGLRALARAHRGDGRPTGRGGGGAAAWPRPGRSGGAAAARAAPGPPRGHRPGRPRGPRRRGRGEEPAAGGRAVRGRPRLRDRPAPGRGGHRADDARRRRTHGPRTPARRGPQRPCRVGALGARARSTRSWSRAWAPAWSPSSAAASRDPSPSPDPRCSPCSPACCWPTPRHPVGRALGRRLLGRGRLVAGTSLLETGRRAEGRTVIVVLTVACALAVFAMDALAIGDRNRSNASRHEAGAPVVIQVTGGDLDGVRSALAAADATGRRATPVLVGRDILAVDPDAFRRIAFFPRGAPTAAEWRALAPPDRQPVELTGTRVSARRADRRRLHRRRHLRQRGRRATEPRRHLRHGRTPGGPARLPASRRLVPEAVRHGRRLCERAADWPPCSSRRRRARRSRARSSSPTCASTAARSTGGRRPRTGTRPRTRTPSSGPPTGRTGGAVRARRQRVLPDRGVLLLGAARPARPADGRPLGSRRRSRWR